MKNIVILNGSPKIGEASASEFLSGLVENHMDKADNIIDIVSVRKSISKNKTDEDFTKLVIADAIIIIFPLYVFCLPGILMRFLEDYYKYYTAHAKTINTSKVYAIVNCGFNEAEINMEAVKVIKSFSRCINGLFRFGIQIGGGPMLMGAKEAPFMKKTLHRLDEDILKLASDIADDNFSADDISSKEIDNISIEMNIPHRFFFFMGNLSWRLSARKNGLKKKDLYRRPYCKA